MRRPSRLEAPLAVLIVLILAALMVATASLGDSHQSKAQAGSDTLEIMASSEGHVAELRYYNSSTQATEDGDYVLRWGDIIARVQLIVGAEETAIVRLDGDDLIVVPERADVPDGEAFVFQIMRPMF